MFFTIRLSSISIIYDVNEPIPHATCIHHTRESHVTVKNVIHDCYFHSKIIVSCVLVYVKKFFVRPLVNQLTGSYL